MKSPAWVLFRGLGRQSAHWGTFTEDLGARFPQTRMFAPDFPGTGKRLNEDSPNSIEGLVNAIRSELAFDLVDRPLWLLGLSLGGMVALSWAQRFPHEVAGIAMVSSSVGGISPPWKRLRPSALVTVARISFTKQAEERERQTLMITSADTHRQSGVLAQWTELAAHAPVSRATLRRQLWAAIKFRPDVKKLSCPTLVVTGAKDKLVHPSCGQSLALALQTTQMLSADAGHDLSLDQPEWLLQQLEMWAKPKM